MTYSTQRTSLGAIALVSALAAVTLLAGPASAQDYRNNQQGQVQQHQGWGRDYQGAHQWRRGQQIGYNDWSGAQAVDYRQHHLRQPPRGYEWRQSNGQYILAAVATGVIASIILSNGR